MMAWKLATSPTTAASASAPAAFNAEDRAKAVEDRLARGAERERAVDGGGHAGGVGDLRSIGIAGLKISTRNPARSA